MDTCNGDQYYRICIINVYMGKLPPCFRKWLESCSWNPTIDFKLITDQDLHVTTSNVSIIHMSFDQVKERATQALSEFGLTPCIDRPYKLCDFKPVYGLMFGDLIEGYDYWGHCDLDLVFGDLRKFFIDYQLGDYQKFLNLGHLSLFKNDATMNRAFSLPVGGVLPCVDALTRPGVFYFDESGMQRICKDNGLRLFEKRVFADIATIYKRFRLALDDVNYDYQAFFVENGAVYRAYKAGDDIAIDEFIYIHFKQRYFTDNQIAVSDGKPYYICPKGYIEKKAGIPTLRDIRRINPFPGKAFEYCERIQFSLKGKLARLVKRLKTKGKQ